MKGVVSARTKSARENGAKFFSANAGYSKTQTAIGRQIATSKMKHEKKQPLDALVRQHEGASFQGGPASPLAGGGYWRRPVRYD